MEVNLSKKSWHYRLQKFTFGGATPDLFSLCPYFWLTIFCMIILPITLAIKLVVGAFVMYDEKILQPAFDAWLNGTIDPLSVYKLRDEPKKYRKSGSPFSFKFWWGEGSDHYLWERWLKQSSINREEANKLAEEGRLIFEKNWDKKREAKREKERKKEESRIARKQKMTFQIFTGIVLWTKRLVTLAITIGGIYLASILTILIATGLTMDGFLGFLKIAGIFIVVALVAIGIFALIYNYVERCKARGHVPIVARFFVWIGKGIGSGLKWFFGLFSIFWEYFKANKNDVCPGVNWKD